MQEVSLGDALVIAMLDIAEYRIPHRAVYDMGYIAKSPLDMVIAVDAMVQLQEIVNDHYGKEGEDPEPPHEIRYFEAEDGDSFWRDEDG
jgi:hypothetical protein